MRNCEELIDAILRSEFKTSLEELQSDYQGGDVSRLRRALIAVLRDDFSFKFKEIIKIVNRKHANCVLQYQKHHIIIDGVKYDDEYIAVYKRLVARYKARKEPELKIRRIKELESIIHAAVMERDQLRLELNYYDK